MKYIRILGCFFVLFFSNLMLSHSQSIYHENKIKFAGIEKKENYYLQKKKSDAACHLHLNYFYPESYPDAAILEKLQYIFAEKFFGQGYAHLPVKKICDQYAKDYVADYKNCFEKSGLYKEELRSLKMQQIDPGEIAALYTYSSSIRNTILFNRGDILSFVTNFYDNKGGAHGFARTVGTMIDLKRGEEMKLSDVFFDDTMDDLADLILSNLKKAWNIKNDEQLLEQGFTFDDFYVSSNFIADNQGVIFIYDQYELGSYYLGTVEVMVPYYDLIVFMRQDGPLYNWAKNKRAGNMINYETVVFEKNYNPFDIPDFPGFWSHIIYTYPKALSKKELLAPLQERFMLNAFGKEYQHLEPMTAIEAVYEDILKEYQAFTEGDDVRTLLQEILAEIDEENAATMIMSFSKKYTQQNIFYYNNHDLISYTIARYYYDGGAHGLDAEQAYFVDAETAKNLYYDDLFLADSRAAVAKLLVHYLKEQQGVTTEFALRERDYDLSALVPSDNFTYNGQYFTFLFQPYEVGPYSLGLVRISIPVEEMKPYIKPSSKLYRIVHEKL